MNRLESLSEKRLREAIESGKFDDLPGKGEPIDLRENPFEDPDLRTVHRLLRNAGFAPSWIEERKDIDAELEAARIVLARKWTILRNARETRDEQSARDRWEKGEAEFRVAVRGLNRRIDAWNLKTPA